jgi:hypothetical protein
MTLLPPPGGVSGFARQLLVAELDPATAVDELSSLRLAGWFRIVMPPRRPTVGHDRAQVQVAQDLCASSGTRGVPDSWHGATG